MLYQALSIRLSVLQIMPLGGVGLCVCIFYRIVVKRISKKTGIDICCTNSSVNSCRLFGFDSDHPSLAGYVLTTLSANFCRQCFCQKFSIEMICYFAVMATAFSRRLFCDVFDSAG